MKLIFYLLFVISIFGNGVVSGHLDMIVPDYKNVFDVNLYESVLDSELCDEQINYMRQNDTQLLIEFLDAGIRTPRGVLTGNLKDLGNYYQCLGINKPIENSVIEGKYCFIDLPLNQNWPTFEWPALEWPEDWPNIQWPWPELNPNTTILSNKVANGLRDYHDRVSGIQKFNGESNDFQRTADSELASINFQLAVCVPKACSPRTALESLLKGVNLSFVEFEERFCRLPNDKPWATGEYVAVAIFSFFGLLVLLSTAYDIRHNVFVPKESKTPRQINKLCLAFSAYTNTRRLVTYNPVPGTLECLDGIRAFAMMWVIIGHTFVTQISSQIMANRLDALDWITSLPSVWITAAPITVDTFFLLSGLLLVYTTAGKLTSMKLLKNLHLFYLNRLLRMFPVLATMILLQISVLNRVVDGPYWPVAAAQTHRCRVYWWSTLLYIQNFVNPAHICLAHSWYLAIDMQLHILSPLVLVWVLSGRKRLAWTALVGAMIAILAASTTYNFFMNFPSAPVSPSRPEDSENYIYNYYVNTLTRASPFFVGLIYGYILHLYRGKKLVISLFPATILWACAITISTLIVYSSYPIMQQDWKNQFADNMINSFMRPAWALALGWLILACVHGYGGPINWVLSLQAWKVLSRLSYAMYIVHYPMMFVLNAMPVAPVFFNVPFSLFRFLADFSLSTIVAFLVTIFIDAPFSVLIKQFLGGGAKRPPPKEVEKQIVEDSKPDVCKL